jgi:recombination-promoting nuclease RpnB
MTVIASAHDKVFKRSLADIRAANEFLTAHLPAEIQALIDLKTLRLSPETYISQELEEFRSDLLFEVELRAEAQLAYIYILVEHQSTVDPLMVLRLWNYRLQIWDRYLQKNPAKSLPMIFPLVVYHGKVSYQGPRVLEELIAGPLDLVKSTLFGPFHLLNMQDMSDEELRARKWSGILLYMLKHVYDRHNERLLETIISLLQGIDGEEGADRYGGTLLKYWWNKAESCKDPQAFLKAVGEGLSTQMGGEVMSMAQQWAEQHKQEGIKLGVQQGMQQGMQQGIQRGEALLLKSILKAKFQDLPAKYLQKIEEAEVEILNHWAIKALSASSLSEVFQE